MFSRGRFVSWRCIRPICLNYSWLFKYSFIFGIKRAYIIFKISICITFSYKTQNNNVITSMHHRNKFMSINIIPQKTTC